MIIVFVMIVGYILFITIENNSLTGRNKRLLKELDMIQAKNKRLVEPLESISKQEPLTALKLLIELVETNAYD